jgi:hypothetical protein
MALEDPGTGVTSRLSKKCKILRVAYWLPQLKSQQPIPLKPKKAKNVYLGTFTCVKNN